MGRILRSLVALAAVLALSTPVPAFGAVARSGSAADPNDTAGHLDISYIEGMKASATAPLHIMIQTYGNWSDAVLATGKPSRMFVLFDTDVDGSAEYKGRIYSVGTKLTIWIKGSGSSFENLAVHRVDPKTIKTVIPGNSTPNPVTAFNMAVKTSYKTSSGACASACVDRAPDAGWVSI